MDQRLRCAESTAFRHHRQNDGLNQAAEGRLGVHLHHRGVQYVLYTSYLVPGDLRGRVYHEPIGRSEEAIPSGALVTPEIPSVAGR